MKEYGMNLAPEWPGMKRTVMLPPGAKRLAEEQLETYDPKRHNTKVVIAEPLPLQEGGKE